ncbi:STAS domain-containing protein [Bacillus sp. ISL-47]|uniref:STAS domain-containing protein n=1 Tax=Bacillus sp. ISL-47 TaxID=2819130 RepID=UPI001BE9E3C0|nr:STAS domain-containing protein [Bacillus sp. ISL-47]MBT2689611.1 STAS domain-containing protein [Bacillus sp. ISL-47]MBT2708430.1 STAS domain-containing protein [Pseudomonas sp. ISL-84]
MTANEKLKNYLLENSNTITEKWLSIRREEDDSSIYSNYMPQKIVKELIDSNHELIKVIATSLSREYEGNLEAWSSEAGERRARIDIGLTRSISHFNVFRDVLWDYLERFFLKNNIDLSEALKLGRKVDNALDGLIEGFTVSYSAYTVKRMRSQQEMIDELSTPIITITDAVAVLPLIGDIDTHRAKKLMEHSLRESSEKEVNCLIVDLSGVLVVDTMVAQELFKIIDALELTGVEVSLTGIRPELAHSIITLGISFDQIKMYNNLMQALKDFGITRVE